MAKHHKLELTEDEIHVDLRDKGEPAYCFAVRIHKVARQRC